MKPFIVLVLCVLAVLAVASVATASPAGKRSLERSIVITASEPSSMSRTDVGPMMPDFPQIPWVGDQCYLRGGIRCCFSPYYEAQVPCRCELIPGFGLIWVYA